MYRLHNLSNGVSEDILPFWIVIHWVFQKIGLPRCELFIGGKHFWSRAHLDRSFRNTGQGFVPSWSMCMGSRSLVLDTSEVTILFALQYLFLRSLVYYANQEQGNTHPDHYRASCWLHMIRSMINLLYNGKTLSKTSYKVQQHHIRKDSMDD